MEQFVETAVVYFLDQRQHSQERLEALRRLGQAVDDAGLYERVLPSSPPFLFATRSSASRKLLRSTRPSGPLRSWRKPSVPWMPVSDGPPSSLPIFKVNSSRISATRG
jgi:hypothetical protein